MENQLLFSLVRRERECFLQFSAQRGGINIFRLRLQLLQPLHGAHCLHIVLDAVGVGVDAVEVFFELCSISRLRAPPCQFSRTFQYGHRIAQVV